MKNKLILSSVALVCAAQAFAYVEKSEVMTIEKADGTTVQYTISDLDRVSFGTVETSYALYIEKNNGDQAKLQTLPKVFLATPAEGSGDPYRYGFSMVEAATPEEARQGEYAVEVFVSQLKMNESVDLAGGAASGVTVALYGYADGEVDKVWEAQTSGSFTMSTNAKNGQVTMTIEANYEDGTYVELTYKGKPTAADDLKGLNPPFVYVNQGQYFNADGVPQGLFNVEGMTHTTSQRANGVTFDHKFVFTLSNGFNCELYVADDLVNAGEINVANLEANKMCFKYNAIQVCSKGTQYANQALEGSLNVVKNDDDTWVIDVTMTNRYIPSWGGGQGGDPSYVIVNYTGAN